MPDYDLNEEGVVRVTIPGRVIDERYTRMLIERRDLTLMDVIALDKVEGVFHHTGGPNRSPEEETHRGATSESLCLGECCGRDRYAG